MFRFINVLLLDCVWWFVKIN